MRKFLVMTAVSTLISGSAMAGSFVPIYERVDSEDMGGIQEWSFSGESANPLVSLECETPPSATEVAGRLTYKSSLMTASQAGKLGFPVFKLGGSRNKLVLVRDYSRSAECLANDGQTKLLYGQAIRTVLTISDWDTNANLNLAMVAADATLSNKTHRILVQVLGFPSPDITKAIQGIADKDFDVTTYADFLSLESKLIEMASKEKNPVIKKLGAVVDVDDSDIENALAVSHAVAQISKGKSCNVAKVNAPNLSSSRERAIENTYQSLIGVCDNTKPSGELKSRAKDMLSGIAVPGA